MIEITGKILNYNTCDSQGDVVTPETTIDFIDDRVPLLLDWGDPIGVADLVRKEDGIWATITIDDPQNIEAMGKLKPCIGGKILKKTPVTLYSKSTSDGLKTELKMLEQIVIDTVSLSLENCDRTIKNLEEMQNDTGT